MTRLTRRACLISLAALPLPLLASAGPPASDDTPHPITQISVIDALMVGRYDGITPIGDLLKLGDLGVGTLDHLDGELVVLDGRAYQIRSDGQIFEVPPDRSTPFAVVTPFRPDLEFPCPVVGALADLDARLDAALPQRNNFAALRIEGRFASLRMRSVARQEPPYRPLDEVARSQSVWTKTDQVGTLIGIRSPKWAGGLNVPGYHWHFLARDRRSGGHVLDLKITEGVVRAAICRDWHVLLEGSDGFNAADLVRDRSRELRRVESSRGAGDH